MRIITGTLRSTQSNWLPVLSNIVPPHIRRQEAVSKLVNKICLNSTLPVYEDIYNPPLLRLPSRHPIWTALPDPDWSAVAQWQQEWSAREVRNQYLITDPAIQPPGHHLARSDWVLLNRYRTGHGRCAATLHDWGIGSSPSCVCGERQTMSHMVNDCPITSFPGGLAALHTADDAALTWLKNVRTSIR